MIISRLTKTEHAEDFAKWIKKVETQFPKLGLFLDFVLVSGLRFVESLNAYNLIIDLAKEGRPGGYYNYETEALEHFRLKKLFVRRTKKAFVSLVPEGLVERTASNRNSQKPKSTSPFRKLVSSLGLVMLENILRRT